MGQRKGGRELCELTQMIHDDEPAWKWLHITHTDIESSGSGSALTGRLWSSVLFMLTAALHISARTSLHIYTEMVLQESVRVLSHCRDPLMFSSMLLSAAFTAEEFKHTHKFQVIRSVFNGRGDESMKPFAVAGRPSLCLLLCFSFMTLSHGLLDDQAQCGLSWMRRKLSPDAASPYDECELFIFLLPPLFVPARGTCIISSVRQIKEFLTAGNVAGQ